MRCIIQNSIRVSISLAALYAIWCGPVVYADSSPSFNSRKATVRQGRTSVIPFSISGPATSDVSFDASAADPGILKVVSTATVSAGQSVGYVRVLGQASGETSIRLQDTSLPIVVIERPPGTTIDERLQIVGPVSGAFVWGEIVIGVEFQIVLAPRDDDLRIRLHLSDGTVISPSNRVDPTGPQVTVLFTVDASDLGEGALEMWAVAEYAAGATITSRRIQITVIHPDGDSLKDGECEDELYGERPERYGDDPPRVGSHSKASGGAYVLNFAPDPAWCLPVDIKKDGLYQFMLTARGDESAGALPTVGIHVDDGERAVTAARLLDQKFHRFALGRPIRLKAGKRVLTLRFMNDFYVEGKADRNLSLDRFELLRIPSISPRSATSRNRAMSMMADNAAPGGSGVSTELMVAFNRPLDGQPVTGLVAINGVCLWRDARTSPAPLVRLLVNDRSVSEQQAASPQFYLDRSYLSPGANRLQMVAESSSGVVARSSVHTVTALGDPRNGGAPREFHRFTPLDDRWGSILKPFLTDKNRSRGDSIARIDKDLSASIPLPQELTGKYALWFDGRTDGGDTLVSFSIQAGDDIHRIADHQVKGWRRPNRVGEIELRQGPKSITLKYEQKKSKQQDAAQILWFRSLSLVRPPNSLDRDPPRVVTAYPHAGHIAHDVDAVVADAYDNDAVVAASLYIDGNPTGILVRPVSGLGRIVLPMPLRGLAPGDHTFMVRVRDRTGNIGDSDEIRFTIASDRSENGGPYARAVHLLNRFAYGPDPRELAAVLTMGEAEYLRDRVSRGLDSPGDRDLMTAARIRFPNGANANHVTQRVLHHLIHTDNPVRARFVLWVQNHFSTWIRKTQALPKWREHLRFSETGPATFLDLLHTSATSPAMLYYLDQQNSFAGRLNENYARELMELHTLGVNAGYTQADVTSLAELLTGWSVSEEADLSGTGAILARVFRFDPSLNSGRSLRVFGMTFDRAARSHRSDRILTALEMLAAHPQTARHVCRKLIEHYSSAPAPKAVLTDITREFMETSGDMKAVLSALALHPGFQADRTVPRVATPLDYAVRIVRTTGADAPWQVREYITRSGMGLFDRAMPDGYPEEDAVWADANALLQRRRFAEKLGRQLAGLIPPRWRRNPQIDSPEWRQKVVDIVALRLTGSLLGAMSNEAALTIFDAESDDPKQWIANITSFVSQCPEAGLR
jgi:uncharacterized protein (DUF1800 family)